MRWLLGLLVLLNVGILIWGSLDDGVPAEPELAPPGVGSIRLVGEVGTAAEPAAVPIPAPPRSDGVMARSPVTQALPVPPPAPAVVTPAEPGPEIAQAEPLDESESAPLKAEADGGTETPETETKPVGQAKVDQPAKPRFCSRIGPFAKRADAKTVSDYLKRRGGQVELSEETLSMHAGYWVMVPPQGSRAAAKALAEKLKANGIKDYWIIPSSEYQHAISLGVFSQQTNAKAFAKRIADKGFPVDTVDKRKERTLVWLSYQGEVFIPPKEIRERAPEGVQAEHQDCP
jgi:hypothetical protein